MRILRLALLASVAVFELVPFPIHAATLRGGTTLSAPTVRLSDLFDGVTNDRVIGPGPEPGGRIIVEAAQLGAIARQFTVDWQPTSTADRIVLERPGHPFSQQDAIAALRVALAVAGVSSDADIEMPGFSSPLVPIDVKGDAEVGQLDYSQAGGQFTAVLSVTAPGMSPAHTRLSGRIVEMVQLPVTVRRMVPGDVFSAADIQITRLRASAARAEIVQTPAQAIGMALRHSVGAGAPIVLADLERPQVVQKGQLVMMALDTPGISVAAEGVAMEGGAIGERVRVLNASSRAVVEAEIMGSGRVRVSGAAPVQLPPGSAIPVRVAAR